MALEWDVNDTWSEVPRPSHMLVRLTGLKIWPEDLMQMGPALPPIWIVLVGVLNFQSAYKTSCPAQSTTQDLVLVLSRRSLPI